MKEIDPTRFEAFASGVNKWAMTLAIIVGGVWALYTYRDVPHRERLKRESEELAAELATQSNLVLQVEANQLVVPDSPRYLIEGVVSVANVGSRNTRLILDPKGQVEVTRVTSFENGEPQFGDSDTTSVFMWADSPPESKTSLRGGTDYLPFVHEVQEPGLYLVSFSANRDEWDVKKAGGHGEGERPLSWTGATYVTVADTSGSRP